MQDYVHSEVACLHLLRKRLTAPTCVHIFPFAITSASPSSLFQIPDSPFCPSCILKLIFRLYPAPTHHFPTFTYRVNSHWCIVTYNWFLQKLKHVLFLIGVDPSRYSGHSFRRGGASFALECGLSPDLIKSQGDWKSGAYQSYRDPSLFCRSKVANRLGEEFRRLFPVSL